MTKASLNMLAVMIISVYYNFSVNLDLTIRHVPRSIKAKNKSVLTFGFTRDSVTSPYSLDL